MADNNKELLNEETVKAESSAPVQKTDIPEPATDADPAVAVDDEETDEALKRFLSREQENKPEKKPSKSRKPLIILIAVIAAVAILVALLVFLRSRPNTQDDEEFQSAELSLSVNDEGVHEADVELDEDGNILQNGSGTLMDYVPADIKLIDVENKDGSFSVTSSTPSGESTVYKIVGLEDYPMQEGIADEIASHSASLEFIRVLSADADLADFGLASPRATVTVKYNDDTSSVIRVGNDAAGEAGTYVSFGTGKAVFLVTTENIEPFLYSVNNLISLEITDTNEDSENAEFSSLTLSGTHFDKPITIEPNKDEALSAAYILTSPVSMPANAIEGNDIAGNIRGLYAESVVCVNPSDDQLSSYGLSEPYATAKASYPDTDINLHASSPNDDGTVYVYNPDKNVVYSIQLAAVCWAKTNLDLLMPENPLNVKTHHVSGIDFTAGDTDFTLDVSSTAETVTDDDGNEQQSYTTTAAYKGKELNNQNFTVFFQNLTTIKNLGRAEEKGKDKVMSVTLRYDTDRAADTLNIYTAADGSKYVMEFNSEIIGTVSRSYINDLIEGADNLISGKTVAGL